MRKYVLSIAVILFGFSLVTVYHNRNENLTAKMIAFALQVLQKSTADKSIVSIDSEDVVRFFQEISQFKKIPIRCYCFVQRTKLQLYLV